MNKLIYFDPFMGKIELTKVGESTRNMQGESVIKNYYIDIFKNFYIDSWTTCGGDPIPMKIINRADFEKLVEIYNSLNKK